MRATLIMTISVSLLLLSCEGAQLREGQADIRRGSGPVSEVKNIVDDSQGGNTLNNNPSEPAAPLPPPDYAAPSDPHVEGDIPDAAYIPISIGGASLTCLPPEDDALKTNCYTKSKAGAPQDFHAKKAYFIVYPDLEWIETSFAPGSGVGAYVVNLPSSMKNKSFAIAFANDTLDVVLDWVMSAADPVPQSIVDGSFEANIVHGGENQTQFIDNSASQPWKAKSRTPGCADVLEYDNTYVDPLPAAHGNQWIELDSACQVTGSISGGNNVIAYQDLNLQIDHVYEVSFQYRYRTGKNKAQKLKVRFGGEEVFSKVVTLTNWTKFKFTRKATAEKVRIEFEEWGDVDGEGTFIDDVIVTDTGKGPILTLP